MVELIDAISDGNNLEAEDEFKNLIAASRRFGSKTCRISNTFVSSGAFS